MTQSEGVEEELRKLLEKATPGDWDCWDMDEYGWHVFRASERRGGQHIDKSIAAVRYGRSHPGPPANYHEQVANAELIVAAKNHLPALLTALSSHRKRVGELEAELLAICELCADTKPKKRNARIWAIARSALSSRGPGGEER